MINQKSIAVLPLDNLSSDTENEYFADGMTEEIINALSKIDGLKVTARTSSFVFKHKKEDVRIIGNQLGVSTVLEGSIRKLDERIRITVQLIRTDNGFHIWSESFDRQLADIFELQDEVSLLIAEKIRENFGHLNLEDHLVKAPTSNLQAYNTYLKARYNHLKWDEEGIKKAIALYSECIETEPGYADPHFGLAYCFAMAGSWWPDPELLKQAEFHIQEGFKLDDQAELGYYAQATLSFWGHWDFQKAQENYIKAIQLNPTFTEAEEGLVELYTATGDFESALKHVEKILHINPLSPNHFFTKANIFYLKHDYSQAENFAEQALFLDPGFTHAIALKQLCLIHSGKQEALNNYLHATPLTERPIVCKMLYDFVNKTKPFDETEIDSMVNEEGAITLFPWNLFINTQAGRIGKALAELSDAVQRRLGQYVNFKHSPFLLPLHTHAQFQKLAASNLTGSVSNPTLASREEKVSILSREEAQPYIDSLTELMEKQAVYLDNQISLRSTAAMINISPNKLSFLLNEFIGKNFNEFVNGYRLEAFKEKALDSGNSHLTLLGLAFDSGFTSKSVFNDFFKKNTGITPKAWVKRNQVN
ncbi:MAG: helix-turn-helix domain-containing protein [Fulvivirga sp.]|uniref:tetratricopeptide repeat protein n=1 Tax=Fulvivirga sp. TaxID=1931237 RepID=UPI0032EB0E4D